MTSESFIPTSTVTAELARVARPLESNMDSLLEFIGDARLVLLGEASHGTHEYYAWRAHISRRLLTEKEFNFIAVEGDWPDCYTVNRYVKGLADQNKTAAEVLQTFKRWPTWMWANWEVVHFIRWLKGFNSKLGQEKRRGFYGLDVYSLWDSLHAVINFLEQEDPKSVAAAYKAFRCFEPYGEHLHNYAYRAAMVPDNCRQAVLDLLVQLREKAPQYKSKNAEDYFNAEQNAVVLKNAEEYYRTMLSGNSESWNIRDHHMTETLTRLLDFYGPESKSIVWEHNTHVGDARATDMAAAGMVNVGQLVRQQHEDKGVVLAGFGSFQGRVIAARGWDQPMQEMLVPPALPGSWENILHQVLPKNKLLLLKNIPSGSELHQTRGHRAIGVVYNPGFEYGNYVPTVLAKRYDTFLYVDRTQAVRPLHLYPEEVGEFPETYPYGV